LLKRLISDRDGTTEGLAETENWLSENSEQEWQLDCLFSGQHSFRRFLDMDPDSEKIYGIVKFLLDRHESLGALTLPDLQVLVGSG
jgi:hypothetical protein